MTDPGHTKRTDDRGWEDRDMLEGVKRRDQDALGRFFDVSFPYVYNVAFRLLGDHHAAEDVAQDVFLKVYRAAHQLDPNRHPKPWITTITYNACRDVARRASTRPQASADVATIGSESPDNPHDELARREEERMVERALANLEEEARVVVILHDYCGFSHDDISRIIGVSHGAARKRYSRALKQMAGFIRGIQG